MGPDPAVAAVRLAVRRALADLAAGDLVLVGLSGGGDSRALAAATAFEAPRAGLASGAVVVDHGLQQGSAEVAAAAAAFATGLGLSPVLVRRVDVSGTGGPEAAARTARHAALVDAADRAGAVAVLLGHTRDDQAETVLLGLARGSGARSLAGMSPVAGLLRRPLLDLDRETVRAAAAVDAEPSWDDPHNEDPAYARVRVRRTGLPALEDSLGPGVAAALARTADLLRADADALDAWAATAAETATHPEGGLDVETLGGLPAAIRTRVLLAAVRAAGAPSTAVTAAHVEAVDRLVTDWHGQGPLHLPGGLRVHRRCGRLQFLTS